MTMPLALLSWSAFLGLLHCVSTGVSALTQHGMEYAVSPRDEQKPLSTGRARNLRAFANFMQTFPIFAAVVLVSHVTGHDHGIATWGAQFYFWFRLLYVPLYVTGSKYRTHAFWLSFLGIVFVFLSIA
jgi:uncharacterized MAPEG superfamily protein